MQINEIYTELLLKAEKDLNLSKLITTTESPDIENACYHSQQCAEKAFKAFLIYSDIPFKHIHNLIILCHKCLEIDDSFSRFNLHCHVLNKYISFVRYFEVPELTINDMNEAIEYAEEILRFVNGKLKWLLMGLI